MNIKPFLLCLCLLAACVPQEPQDPVHKALKTLAREKETIEGASPETLRSKDFVQEKIKTLYVLDQAVSYHLLFHGPLLAAPLDTFSAQKLSLLKILLHHNGGWLRQSIYGKDIDEMTWILVQHADEEVAFQKSILKILEHLYPLGETNPKNYAYLFDRIAVNEGRKQRYGTQLKEDPKTHEMGVLPLEDPAHVDEFRASVGLMSLADYLAFVKEARKNPQPPSSPEDIAKEFKEIKNK